MSILWKPLSVLGLVDADLPPLFISVTFGQDSYDVYLTDLTHIWGESLDHKTILRRSQEEATSIDPSDGDQLHIFLEKIRSGIEGGKDTASSLSIVDTAGRPSITLNITVHLPGGLGDLEWPIYLSAAPQSLLTSRLTIPLMEAQHTRLQEISSLTEVLAQKDHVIQKLLDNMEDQGTQLGHVFPQAAGKAGRKVDRAKAAEKVKGLGPFDVQAWRSGLQNESACDVTQLVKDVFNVGNPGFTELQINTQLSSASDGWWETSKGKTIQLYGRKSGVSGQPASSKRRASSKSSLEANDSAQDDDDDFQTQATPPRPASRILNTADDDSTDDDDDFDPPSQHPKRIASPSPEPPPTASPPRPKKLGKLGGKKAAPQPPPPVDEETTDDEVISPIKPSPKKQASPEPQKPAPKKKGGLGRIGGNKEPPPPPKEPTPPPAELPKPKKGKLGVIGGKKKEPTPVASPTIAQESPSVTPPPQQATPVKRKLGTIGGRAKTPAKEGSVPAESTIDIVERGRATKVQKEETPPPRETSEERADRKRIELKRELEAKAKAPAKKKRKF